MSADDDWYRTPTVTHAEIDMSARWRQRSLFRAIKTKETSFHFTVDNRD